MKISPRTKYECDICGTVCKKNQTKVQKGLRRCPSCIDDIREIKPLNLKWESPRPSSNTTTAVNTSTVYDIVAATGITLSRSLDTEYTGRGSLGISNVPSDVVFGAHYFQIIQGSGGNINITANPQISAGQAGDLLTLEGNSDSATVLIEDGNGVSLTNGLSCTLGAGDTLVLSYNSTDSVWVECSRASNYK